MYNRQLEFVDPNNFREVIIKNKRSYKAVGVELTTWQIALRPVPNLATIYTSIRRHQPHRVYHRLVYYRADANCAATAP